MTATTKTTALAALLMMIACGATNVPSKGVTDSASAAEAVVTIQNALKRASAAGTARTKADRLDLDLPCDSGSGTAIIDTVDNGAGTVNVAYAFTYSACSQGDERISGNLDWTVSTTLTATVASSLVRFDGSIAYEGPTFAGNFSFDGLEIRQTRMGNDFVYEVTGNYSIGGTQYAVDKRYAFRFFE